MPDRLPIVVIGAGAAGLMAARFAAQDGAEVILLERTKQGGKKIIISGGGRCNVLPSEVDPGRFVTASSPNTLRNLLLSWPLDAQRRYFEDDLSLPLALEPETGKLFPVSNRATDVRGALLTACHRAGVDLRFNTLVTGLSPVSAAQEPNSPPGQGELDGVDRPGPNPTDLRPFSPGGGAPKGRRGAPDSVSLKQPSPDGHWRVDLGDGSSVRARSVIIATGGLSVPNTGSDGFGLRVAEALGHTMKPTYPALTPLLADPAPHADLAGLSLIVRVEAPLNKGRFETVGGFLFTHRGYSGPAALNVSHLATLSRMAGAPPQPLLVQWTDDDGPSWDAALREHGGGTVLALLRAVLPTRLADRLAQDGGIPPERTRADLRKDERKRLVEVLTRYPLPWTGDEGYKKAEITGGGVALNEVHPKTLESRRHPGLFFCGEVLDAFGPIGGYNFMWAWSTGRMAGRGAARGGA